MSTPISSHGVGEVDQECLHVCSINVAHSVHIKRLGYTIYYKYKVELEGSCQTPFMKDMQKDISNMPVLAVVFTFGSAPMRRYRGGVMTPGTLNSSLTTPSMSSRHSPSLSLLLSFLYAHLHVCYH